MPLRFLRYFLQTEKIVDKLAESSWMRRAAQITAYLFFKGKAIGGETLQKLQEADSLDRTRTFKNVFKKELKDGFKQMKEEAKKRSK